MTQHDLVRDLRVLGLHEGDSVLVHSSLRSLGYVEGGAATVIAALTEAVGPEGTVLFPSHTGAATYSPENPPDFDARFAPCRRIGIIPETARLTEGFVRSLSPTHSVVARGRLAKEFTATHHLAPSPCGEGSPYDLLARAGGKILLIGCDQESNTSIHMIEENVGVDYHLLPGSAEFTIIDLSGQPVKIRARFHRWGAAKVFNRVEPALIEAGAETLGRLGSAPARLIDAAQMRDIVANLLQTNAHLLLA